MRIYHCIDGTRSTIFGELKNVKKKYKSIDNMQQCIIQSKTSVEEDQKKQASEKQKKKISKKNIKFLERLGLKVKY